MISWCGVQALDNFQRVQREAAAKERQGLQAAQQETEGQAIPPPGQLEQGQSRTQVGM